MNTDEFLELLEHPERIADQNIDHLRELAHRYSYSQPMQLLYAVRLRYSSEHLFDRQLGKTSILTNDRSVLFELFEEPTKIASPTEAMDQDREVEKTEPVLKDLKPELEQEELEETAPSLAEKPHVDSAETDDKIEDSEERAEVKEQKPTDNTNGDEPLKADKPEEVSETKSTSPAKPSAQGEMSDRIKDILERNRKLRQDLEQKRSAQKNEGPKEDEAAPTPSAEKPPHDIPVEEKPKGEQPETDSLEGEVQLSQKDEWAVENTTNDFVEADRQKEREPSQRKSPREVEMHHSDKPEKEERESLEGEALMDESDREEVSHTTNDFIEEESEGEAKPQPKEEQFKEEQDTPVLEGEALMAEREREAIGLTTNEMPEEELPGEKVPENKDEIKASDAESSAIESRIASIRKRLAQLHDEDSSDLGETEEQALLSEQDKAAAELTTNDDVDDAQGDKLTQGETAGEELDEEYLEIEALVDQHRKEREQVLVDQVQVDEESEEEELTIDREALEQEVSGHTDEAMSNEEAQRYSFSRWVRQFEKSADQKQAEKSKQEEKKPSEPAKKELDFDRKVELLDSFVEKLPDLKKRKPLISNPPKPEPKPAADESTEEDDSGSLVTETLAKVYIRQKHYKKAVQAYEILKLKYPEKSGFFASRISEINKLANSK